MSERSLFDKAKCDYSIALKIEGDNDIPGWIDGCCYHLQQGIEKLLKFMINTLGGRFDRTHDIGRLYLTYTSLGGEELTELTLFSGTLTMWEACSRYDNDFTATQDEIDIAKRIYCKLESIAVQCNSFDPIEFAKSVVGDKWVILPTAALNDCKSQQDCLDLIDSLKHLL